MTDADYLIWLKSPSAIRMVLIEAVVNTGGSEVTRYLSTDGYVTTPSDTPANQQYLPIVNTGIKFTEQLSLGTQGQSSLSVGDIEIANYAGERDSWLLDVWDNRQIQVFFGDPRWARSDFRMIFNGIIAGVACRSRDVINLKMTDKLQRLNYPIIDTKLGGTTPNTDVVLPIALGECHNIAPLLSDPTTLEYTVHNGPVESIFEVRDNGIPITVTTNNTTGKFNLNQASSGSITVSMQGDKNSGVYANTISTLIQRIVTGYGNSNTRFSSGDLDSTQLAAFNAAHPQPVGIFLDTRANVITTCQQLAQSVGAQMVMSRLGLLQIIQIDVPGIGTPVVVGTTQMVEKTFQMVSRPTVVGSVLLGFNKNWTVQSGLLTTIPDEDKSLFATEWLTSTQTNSTVQTKYKLNAQPVQQDTMLLTRADTDTEANRQLTLWSTQRTVYQFEGTADLLLALSLGCAITVYNARYNLSGGATGMVISLSPDWMTGRVTVQVLI